MATYVYPDTIRLQAIAQELLPRLQQDRPAFDIFPTREVDDWVISWEQKDNYLGLQQLRGLNGAPPKVKRIGAKRYTMEPGAYGEFTEIDERELVRRRQLGSFDAGINITDLVTEAQEQLLLRRLDRIESIIWTLLATGTFSVPALSGAIAHTDTYTMQTFTAAVPWSTPATSTPLADFRAVKLLGRGHSVDFGSAATAYMNSTTANRLYANTNNTDIGRYTTGLLTTGVLTRGVQEEVAAVNLGSNLPTIVEYDQGYYDDSGTFQLFIPTGTVVVIGRRPAGQIVGEYIMARNANNPDNGPGAYMKVFDRGDDVVPRTIEVHDGHSGGPALYYASSIVKMAV